MPEGAVLGAGEEVVGIETVKLQFPYCMEEWNENMGRHMCWQPITYHTVYTPVLCDRAAVQNPVTFLWQPLAIPSHMYSVHVYTTILCDRATC